MAEKEESQPESDSPREFSNGERVKTGKESPDKDIFEEALEGKETKSKEPEEDEQGEQEGKGDEGQEEEDSGEEREQKEAEEGLEVEGGQKEEDSDEEGEEEPQDLEKETDTKEEGTKEEVDAPDSIKETILQKAAILSSKDKGERDVLPLKFLEDEKTSRVFIGRKKSVFKQYGFEAALLLGKVSEPEHKEKDVYFDGLNPHVVFVCGARGSGKCLTGDTLVTLENGEIIPIKEIEKRKEIVFALDHVLKIKKTSRSEFFKRTVDKTLTIKLNSGKEINLTPEHPLLTINGWKPAQELSVGCRIATPRVLPAFGNSTMKACDVKILAYLIAEGHLSNEFVLFSNEDEKIIADFNNSVQEFDSNPRVEMHSKEGCFRVAQKKKKVDLSNIVRNKKGQFTNKGFVVHQKSSLMQWLESIGVYGKLSADKFFPKEIMCLKKELLSLFLNRLFSCDGTIHRINKGKNWSVSIGFSSEKMTRQVQHLLTRFGIISKFRKKLSRLNGKTFKNFEIVLYSENVIQFLNEIGFYGAKEKKACIAFKEMVLQKRNPNLDTIPKEIWKTFKISNWKKMARELGYAPQSFHNTRNYAPSRERLLKMAQMEGNKGVQMLAESDIYWDIIKDIKQNCEKTEVYDITVPGYHNFVANDVVVHNSYALGIIAEELALKNKNVGTILIDPIGVFWSMRFPNKEKRELEKLREWQLKTRGLDNLKVFIPKGFTKNVPKTTFDSGFAIQPSLLTGEDWTLTFSIDRFSVTGLLLEQAIKKVEKGYKEIETGKKVLGKGKNYSIDDIIACLRNDSEINSREIGYKQDSIRALSSRFQAAKNWGIFSQKGTPLGELSREGQLTVLDTSFLDDNVTALVIGVLSRRILAARKISTRKEAAQKFKSLDVDQLLELEIPPTWLIVDEAHTLIPSGNEKTPASNPLIEYAKQGRRPGCSLVFATQQPSAIDTKVLSQLDIILTHKLAFDDDVKAVNKRTPTIIPSKYRKSSFIKTLPVGVALVGDRREETSRAFVMEVRPRFSQHEGRDIETTDLSKDLTSAQAKQLAIELIHKDVLREGELSIEKIEKVIDSMNAKYNAGLDLNRVLDTLEEKGLFIGEESISLKESPAEELEEELEESKELDKEKAAKEVIEELENVSATELLALPQKIDKQKAQQTVNSFRKKKLFGLLGEQEEIQSLGLKYITLWRVKYEVMSRSGKEFLSRECFINAHTGEFVHFSNNNFVESKGLKEFFELDEESLVVLRLLKNSSSTMDELVAKTGFGEGKVHRILKKLNARNLIGAVLNKKTGKRTYGLKEKIDLPPSERHELLGSVNSLPIVRAQVINKEREVFSRKDIPKVLQKLWKNVVVKEVFEIYKPAWVATLSLKGKERTVLVDAVTGKIISG